MTFSAELENAVVCIHGKCRLRSKDQTTEVGTNNECFYSTEWASSDYKST